MEWSYFLGLDDHVVLCTTLSANFQLGHGLNDSQDTKTAVKFIILTNLQNSTFMLQPRPWVGILSQMT